MAKKPTLSAFERAQVSQATENYKQFKKNQGKPIGRKTAETVRKQLDSSVLKRRKAGQSKKRNY